ncbi:hypothetical protein [Streptomyces kanamyceticus]|uniref:Uncharacterized protein n=1 Tax=Streptomyces kanamyceticus TaxID=1967 RepID=A0A5J6G8Y2_STRKN|nr:hypothetical protein [Streptomyces kanamyceticus]QEU90251.1 hypothetical protein CP970_04455 [Streptomyces kanamyceticus]
MAAAVIGALGAVAAAVIGVKLSDSGGDPGPTTAPPTTSPEHRAAKPAQPWKSGTEFFLNVPAQPYDLDSPWAHADARVSGSDVQVAGSDRDTLAAMNGATMAVITTHGKPTVEECRKRVSDTEMTSATIEIGQSYCFRTTEENTVVMQIKRLQNDANGVRQVVAENSFADG